MGQASIRQLATAHGINATALRDALGKQSGSDTVNEESPEVKAAIARLKTPTTDNTDTETQASQTHAQQGNGSVGTNVMVQEVQQGLYSGIDLRALADRIQGQVYYNQKVGEYMGLSLQEAIALYNSLIRQSGGSPVNENIENFPTIGTTTITDKRLLKAG